MLNLCNDAQVRKIITYKLDRISRSLLDFVLLLSELEKNDTELISCTESFSSKSEMGVLIMKLLVMFAELERKNIRTRVRDNYYARGEKGFYLGGYPPFGYKKCEIVIDGKKTSGYQKQPDESLVVKDIFNRLSNNHETPTSICRYLNCKKIYTQKSCKWTTTSLIRLIKNPFYVMADANVYEFLIKKGGKITSEIQSFNSKNGIICYGKKAKGNRFDSFENCHLTVGRHIGLISSEIWLSARNLLESKRYSSNQKGNKSFLTGMIFCGECNKKYTTTTSKGHTYFYCRNKKTNACETIRGLIKSDYLEKICEKVIISTLCTHSKRKKIKKTTPEISQLRCEIATLKSKIKIINERIKVSEEKEFKTLIETLLILKNSLNETETKLESCIAKSDSLCYTELKRLAEVFPILDSQKKREVAIEIIEKIVISNKKTEIFLKM